GRPTFAPPSNSPQAQILLVRQLPGKRVPGTPAKNSRQPRPRCLGSRTAVAPDGTVYGTWEDYSGKNILTDKSTNGGATWGTDPVVTNYRINTGTFFISIPPQPDRGVL